MFWLRYIKYKLQNPNPKGLLNDIVSIRLLLVLFILIFLNTGLLLFDFSGWLSKPIVISIDLPQMKLFEEKNKIEVFEEKQEIEVFEDRADGRADEEGVHIIRETLEFANIPYNESVSASLQDKTKQIDNALLQTLTRLDIPFENLKVENTHFRLIDAHAYQFQRMYLVLPESVSHEKWNEILKESLELWANGVELIIPPKNEFFATIKVNKYTTHTIVIESNESAILNLPQLSIVIDDMGNNLLELQALLALEFPVTVSILPDTPHASAVAQVAHASGHEVFLHQPMEAIKAVHNSKKTDFLSSQTSLKKVEEILSQSFMKVPHASGINNHTGSLYTSDEDAVETFLAVLVSQRPDIIVLDSFTHLNSKLYEKAKEYHLKTYQRSVFLDNEKSVSLIIKQLDAALALAEAQGAVVAIGHPFPETLKALKQWKAYNYSSVQIVPLNTLR